MDWSKIFDILFFDASLEEKEGIQNADPSDLVQDLEKTIQQFNEFDWSSVPSEDVLAYSDSMRDEMRDEWKYFFPVFSAVETDRSNGVARLEITPDWNSIEHNSFALYCHLLILRTHLPVSLEDAGIVIYMDSLDSIWDSLDSSQE